MGLGIVSITSGAVDEGIAHCEKVAASDPRSQILPWAEQSIALGHFVACRYAEAIAWAQRSLRRKADVARTLLILAAAAALGDDSDLARQTAERLLASYPDFRIADFGNWPFKDPEPAGRLVEGLRRAGLPE
jgi:tetratricopeptide (TPR) repeat protein